MAFEHAKKSAGIYAADFVRQGMTIGIGSGSTVYWFIQELGKRAREGLDVQAVPTSDGTADLAIQAGIRLVDLNNTDRLVLTIDGADEIDPNGQLIKGGGGALLREKIVAAASDDLIIIADSSKLVEHLGKFPLPVEVIPFGYKVVKKQIIRTANCTLTLRRENGEIFATDQHHYILDCQFEKIGDAAALNTSLHLIPGVVETGLFIDMAGKAVIGHEDGRVEIINYRKNITLNK